MDMQNVAKLEIPEGEVRTIHDKNGDLLWGKVGYSVKYKGDTAQNGTPTPSAPVPVHTVTGENVVNICGKNLLNPNDFIKGRIDNGVIGYANNTTDLIISEGQVSFTTNLYYRGVISGMIGVLPNTEYSYSMSSSSSGLAVFADSYDSAGNWISRLPDYTHFTTPNNCAYIRVSFQLAQAGTYVLTNPQLEPGSTATAYEPYQSQSYEMNLGKNLLNLNGFVKGRLDNGVLGYASNTTALSVDGDSISFTTNANYRGITTEYIPVEPNGTYSTNIPTTGIYGAEVAQYDSAKNFISQGAVYATQTYSGTTHYIRIYLFLRNSGSATLDDLQFERGSQATSYAAYFTPIELCKIGDYQDYIWNDNGTWKVHKATGKLIFNGTEDWSDTSGNNPFYTTFSPAAVGNYCDGLCSHFRNQKAYPSSSGYFAIRNNGASISFNNSATATLSDWTTWLGSNNVSAYYPLATPTDTEITNQTLIAQLEAVNQWTTRYGYNASVTGNLPIIIDRTAL